MTTRPDHDATSALRSLVRQGPAPAFSAVVNPTTGPIGEFARPGRDIKSLLREQPVAKTEKHWPRRQIVARATTATVDAPDLRTLLRSSAVQPAFRQSEDRTAPQAPVADIKALVRGSHASANVASPAAPKAASLQSPPLTGLAHARSSRDGPQDDESARLVSAPRVKQILVSLMVLLSLAAGVAVWHRFAPQTAQTVTKPLREQVLELGKAVDVYRKTQGSLPTSLQDLPEFPDHAIALPPGYCGGTLLDDRSEFFLTRVSGGRFSIVGRYRNEAWAYVDGSAGVIPVPAH